VGHYSDEHGGRHWVRIVEVFGALEAPCRYRVDLALAGISGGWGVSLDGFAGLAEAEDYVTMTSSVEWSAEPTASALMAGRAHHDASVAVWYSGGRRSAADLVTAAPTFDLDDFVDAGAETIEIVVEADDVEPLGHAA